MSEHEHDHHEHNLEALKQAARERIPVTHWTTLEELRGDPDVLRLKGEEFHEKPETYYAQENGKNGTWPRRALPQLVATGTFFAFVLNFVDYDRFTVLFPCRMAGDKIGPQVLSLVASPVPFLSWHG